MSFKDFRVVPVWKLDQKGFQVAVSKLEGRFHLLHPALDDWPKEKAAFEVRVNHGEKGEVPLLLGSVPDCS